MLAACGLRPAVGHRVVSRQATQAARRGSSSRRRCALRAFLPASPSLAACILHFLYNPNVPCPGCACRRPRGLAPAWAGVFLQHGEEEGQAWPCPFAREPRPPREHAAPRLSVRRRAEPTVRPSLHARHLETAMVTQASEASPRARFGEAHARRGVQAGERASLSQHQPPSLPCLPADSLSRAAEGSRVEDRGKWPAVTLGSGRPTEWQGAGPASSCAPALRGTRPRRVRCRWPLGAAVADAFAGRRA